MTCYVKEEEKGEENSKLLESIQKEKSKFKVLFHSFIHLSIIHFSLFSLFFIQLCSLELERFRRFELEFGFSRTINGQAWNCPCKNYGLSWSFNLFLPLSNYFHWSLFRTRPNWRYVFILFFIAWLCSLGILKDSLQQKWSLHTKWFH